MNDLRDATTAALRRYLERERLVVHTLHGDVQEFDERTGCWRTVLTGSVPTRDTRSWDRTGHSDWRVPPWGTSP